MAESSTADVIAAIRRQDDVLVESLRPLFDAGEHYALVDYPNYSNVGDSAIWLGQLAICRRLSGTDPSYVCHMESYDADELSRTCPAGPILITGGGNFGDLWEPHQNFRKRLLADFPSRKIVQLPQSIHFSDAGKAAETRDAIATHGNFRMFVRDRNSQRVAQETLNVSAPLVPDLAFGIGPIPRRAAPSHDYMLLMRTDQERAALSDGDFTSLSDSITEDWIKEPRLPLGYRTGIRLQSIVSCRLSRQAQRLDFFNRLAQRRFDRGARMLSQGHVVVTDRLHAHIMSVLLAIPNVVLDNHYGKIGSYVAAWTGDLPLVRKASSATEAAQAARALLAGLGDAQR